MLRCMPNVFHRKKGLLGFYADRVHAKPTERAKEQTPEKRDSPRRLTHNFSQRATRSAPRTTRLHRTPMSGYCGGTITGRVVECWIEDRGRHQRRRR